MFILLKNKKIKLFIIIIILFILFFILFGLYKYFTYKKEPFQNSCPDCVFNGVDPEHRLNKCDKEPIVIPVNGTTNTLIRKAINSLNLENVTKSMDSTLWTLTNTNVQADTCSPVATTTAPETTVVSTVPITCSYGSLRYVGSNKQPLIDNNQKIIVIHESDFPDPIDTAVGYVITGKYVPENTTIVECTVERWNTYGSKKISALALLLSNSITKYDKDQTFCYQPPPINCEIIWPSIWSDCEATCNDISSTSSGTKSQTGTRSVPLGTNLYGGTDCPTVLIRTEACTKNCPVSCKQNNPWTDDSTRTCKVPGTNATCGTGGKKWQTRAPPSQAINSGQACSAEQNLTERQVDCILPSCAIDCVLSDWQNTGTCISATGASCGAGKQTQTKIRTRNEAHGGTCNIPTQQVDCNLGACPANCVLGDWVNVNANDKCTSSTGATCGTGKGTILQRKIVTQASANGGTCNNPDTSRECDMAACTATCPTTDWTITQACPTCKPVDTTPKKISTKSYSSTTNCNQDAKTFKEEDCTELSPCPPDVNCSVSAWSPAVWPPACSTACGQAAITHQRTRTYTEATGTGTRCSDAQKVTTESHTCAATPACTTVPSAPTITYVGPQTVTATGFTPSRTIGLRLNPPTNIGGSPITEYYIYGGPLLTENSPATIPAANIGNIYHGQLIPFSSAFTSTTFYLKAKNSVGISPAGTYTFNHSDWIISAEPPRDLSITMIESTNPANTGRITYPPIRNFKLTWTPPANNINGTLTKYIVRYIDKNGATKNIDVTSTSTGLIPVETSINISEFRTEVFVSGTGYGVTYGYDVNGDYTFYVKSVYANGISSTEISKTLKISTTAGVWGQPPTINQRLI